MQIKQLCSTFLTHLFSLLWLFLYFEPPSLFNMPQKSEDSSMSTTRWRSVPHTNVYHQMAIGPSHQCRCWRTKGVTSPGGSQWRFFAAESSSSGLGVRSGIAPDCWVSGRGSLPEVSLVWIQNYYSVPTGQFGSCPISKWRPGVLRHLSLGTC